MVSRKIIKQGSGGYTIYIPKQWVDKKGLKAGDQIEIQDTREGLLLAAQGTKRKEATIPINDENNKLVRTIISSYYRHGYTSLVIRFSKQYDLRQISEVVQTFRGFEIKVAETKNVVIEDIAQPHQESILTLLNTLFHKVDFAYESVFVQRKSSDDLTFLKKDIHKLRDYLQRVIFIQGSELSLELSQLVMLLEKVADVFFKLEKKKEVKFLHTARATLKEMREVLATSNEDAARKLYLTISTSRKEFQKDTKSVETETKNYCFYLQQLLFAISSRLQILSRKGAL